jgi:hypothetical protein
MEKAKRARKAETPKQPSLCLRLRAPYLYPDRRRPVRITEGLPWLLLGELLPVSSRVCCSGSLTVRHPSYEAVGCPESSVSPFSWVTAQERHEQNAVDERGCFPFPFPYDPIRNGKRKRVKATD